MGQTIGDPVDVLLDGDDHVADHRRAARSGDGEEVGKAGDGEAEVGARPAAHFAAAFGLPGRGCRCWARRRSWRRTGGEDDAVERVLGRLVHALRDERLDRLAAEIDQRDVVAIERVIVAGVDADALGAERVVRGEVGLGDGRVVHRRADLGPDEIGGSVVCLFRVRRSAKVAAKPGRRLAALLVLALPLLGRRVQGACLAGST